VDDETVRVEINRTNYPFSFRLHKRTPITSSQLGLSFSRGHGLPRRPATPRTSSLICIIQTSSALYSAHQYCSVLTVVPTCYTTSDVFGPKLVLLQRLSAPLSYLFGLLGRSRLSRFSVFYLLRPANNESVAVLASSSMQRECSIYSYSDID